MNNLKIFVPVVDEKEDLAVLLSALEEEGLLEDTVVIVDNSIPERSKPVKEYLYENFLYRLGPEVLTVDFAMQFHQNFANYRNWMVKFIPCDIAVMIDADELPTPELFARIKQIRTIPLNDLPDIMYIPRENKVTGITPEDIQKWGWTLDQDKRINYPDYQGRIYKPASGVKWVSNVHERLEGGKTIYRFEMNKRLDLLHHKTIERQRKQNAFYEQY